jgi:hypothetical protein
MIDLSIHRIKHLEMLQRTIERVARQSVRIKLCCLASVAAVVSVSAGVHAWALALAGAALVIIFWYLDAIGLAQERQFRAMYDETLGTRSHLSATFSMTPSDSIKALHTVSATLWGRSERIVYITLLALLMLAAIIELLSGQNPSHLRRE